MSAEKTVYHGTTVIGEGAGDPMPPTGNPGDPRPPSGNPPPYTPAQPSGVPVQPQTTYIVQPVMIAQMGPKPQHYVCKSCHKEIITRTESNSTTRTHLFALLLCVIGCWPCVCLPYCMDDCMSTDHYCPNCGSYVGSHAR